MAGDHVFESYIRTTPEALWRALTDGTVTPQYYYGVAVESTWEVGAPYRYATPVGSLVEGEVLAAEAPFRLETTFRAAFQPGMAEMPPSHVSWTIDPLSETCKLTLTHSGLDTASPFSPAILGGWAVILSSLKTLLETGTPLVIRNES
jgi:uncharacterized protein YndB with AHSA1/START domain